MNQQNILYRCHYFSLAFLLLLAACSSQVPDSIKKPLKDAPDIEQVKESPEKYISNVIRWGGIIIKTDNLKDASRLTIVAYPLNKYGEPQTTKNSLGRFIVHFDSFLEPKVYQADRLITVLGKVIATESNKIDEFSYQYPVISVTQHYLWPTEEMQPPVYPPWWYDPYYWPYYPPHRHP